MMRNRISRLNGREILSAFLKILFASAAMSSVSYGSYKLLITTLGASTFFLQLIEAFVPIALGGVTFFVLAKILKVNEVEKLVGALKRKFLRR
jgi:putative peptidoglycan lipid II flippase